MKLKNKLSIYSILITLAELATMAAFLFVFFHAGYASKVLVKLGLQEAKPSTNWAVTSWNNTLQKLDYDADIVFFGDSIIRGSDFRTDFTNKKIVNLGYSGDTLSGMMERVSGVIALNPEQVFILGGINNLTEDTVTLSIQQYAELLDVLQQQLPGVQIYVHSILPISKEKETSARCNSTIQLFNQQLQHLAMDKGVVYIDLFAAYELDGYMNPALTSDGIHLYQEAYDRWAEILKEYIAN